MIKVFIVLLTISVTFVNNADPNEIKEGADKVQALKNRKNALKNQLQLTKKQLANCLRNRKPTEIDGQSARINQLEDENLRLRKQNNELKYELEYNVKYVKKLQQDLSSQSNNLCQRETKNLENKIIKLEEDNSRKAKENKFQLLSRIKNYLSGNGPYSQEQQRQFYNFKEKIANLETIYKDKLSQIQRINKEKEDISLQQKYCRAQLSDFNQQIVELEKEAESKGKSYYLKEIKRLADKRFATYCDSKQETGNIMIRSLQKQVQVLEQKLNKANELKEKFERQKEKAQKRTKECENDLDRVKRSGTGSQTQKLKLSQQNNELRKLIQDIYSIKNK